MLNLAGVRAIYVKKIVLKNKKVKKPIPKGSPRPSSENLALFVEALKVNGPISNQEMQGLLCISRAFTFLCAKFLKSDGVIDHLFPHGRGPGKSVYYSLVGDKV